MIKSKTDRYPNIIKIELADFTSEWQELNCRFSRWEDDGGAPLTNASLFSHVQVPFKTGNIVKIVRTRLINNDGKIYYEAEIQPVNSGQ